MEKITRRKRDDEGEEEEEVDSTSLDFNRTKRKQAGNLVIALSISLLRKRTPFIES